MEIDREAAAGNAVAQLRNGGNVPWFLERIMRDAVACYRLGVGYMAYIYEVRRLLGDELVTKPQRKLASDGTVVESHRTVYTIEEEDFIHVARQHELSLNEEQLDVVSRQYDGLHQTGEWYDEAVRVLQEVLGPLPDEIEEETGDGESN